MDSKKAITPDYYLDGVTKLSGLSKSMLNDIVYYMRLSAGHDLYEGIQNDNNPIKLSTPYGIISILTNNEDDKVLYSFEPNREFRTIVDNVYKNQESPVVEKASEAFVKKITEAYDKLI